MFYVKTKEGPTTLITSYTTEKQAERYGFPIWKRWHYMSDGITNLPTEKEESDELEDRGVVRSMLQARTPLCEQGVFRMYLQDQHENWFFSGITFRTYSDANKALKSVLNNSYGDIMIVEGGDYDPEREAFTVEEGLK